MNNANDRIEDLPLLDVNNLRRTDFIRVSTSRGDFKLRADALNAARRMRSIGRPRVGGFKIAIGVMPVIKNEGL